MKMKSRLHRYNIFKPTCRHGQKYSNKKKYFNMMMLIRNKQRLSDI